MTKFKFGDYVKIGKRYYLHPDGTGVITGINSDYIAVRLISYPKSELWFHYKNVVKITKDEFLVEML